jgi:Tfp pilus assembly protein PilZ
VEFAASVKPTSNSLTAVVQGKISDLSEGGVFILTKESLSIGDGVWLDFNVHKTHFYIEGRVAHTGTKSTTGFGVQFVNLTSSQKRLVKNTVKALEVLGYEPCREKINWLEDFRRWTTVLFTTGEGLLPQTEFKKATASSSSSSSSNNNKAA